MEKTKVLFIDDDPSLQMLAKALLSAGAFEVFSALRTKEAENILASRKMDIIVCDVMMPDEDGLAFCRRLRDRGDKTPLLFLSASSRPEAIQAGLTAGGNEYLVKPFDIHELQKKLLGMLGKYLPARARPAPPPPEKKSGLLGWFKS